jgi:PAS domain S-box-containing protein
MVQRMRGGPRFHASGNPSRGIIEMPSTLYSPSAQRFRWLNRLQQSVSAFAFCGLIAFAWFSWVQHGQYQRFEAEFEKVLFLRDKIAEYDQSLTVNAILVAATGDSHWESVYRAHAPLLDQVLLEAHALVDQSTFAETDDTAQSVDKTSAANTRLCEMEDLAMSLGNAGNQARALQILTSGEYRNLKAEYNQGMLALSHSLQRYVENRGQTIAEQSYILGLSAIAIVALIAVAAILMIVDYRKRTKLVQGELAENRELLALAMRSAEIEPWDWNIETGEIVLSDRFVASLGYDRSELTPQIESLRQLLHPADKSSALEAADRTLAAPELPYESTFRLQARDGKWKSIIARGRVVTRNANGSAARMVGTYLDVTQRVQLEAQLSQSQRLESIGQLAAGIAHEINTPMQFLSDNIEYLSECCERLFEVVDVYEQNLLGTSAQKSWDARKSELASVIERNQFKTIRDQVPRAIEESLEGVRRVITIVRAMKEFSHQGRDEKVGVDLNNAVRSTIMISRNRWKYVADMETDLDPDLPTLRCVPAEINQVLLNLVVNAADAVADVTGNRGDSKGHIKVSTRRQDESVLIEVSDTGCGIPAGIRERIFDPFFTTKDVGKGTGQGLAICYNVVVAKHHGTIDVDSEPGSGSTFRVRLPIGADSARDPSDGTSRPSPLAAISA